MDYEYSGSLGVREYYIYVMLSETPTKFGGAIRRVGRIKYNHASIAFDENFRMLYSFGRRCNSNPLNAGLVKEHLDRFTLKQKTCVNVCIYKLPVTREQYHMGERRVHQILSDPEGYLYNLFSVLSHPILGGFETYKAYSCTEFVAHLLKYMGLTLPNEKQPCTYTPEELGAALGVPVFFEGNLLDVCSYIPPDSESFFLRPNRFQVARSSCATPCKLLYRKLRHRHV